MRLHPLAALVTAGALAVPVPAHALGTIEGFYGIARPPGTSFRREAAAAANDPHLFKNSLQSAGGDVLFNLGSLELGAIADVSWAKDSASQSAIGALAGLKLPVGPIRLDLLGEAGGHRYGNLAKSPNIARSGADKWFAYVGLRPGAALHLGGAPGFLVGVWTYVRWDLTSERVPVTVEGASSASSVKLGGPSIGATLRLGFDF